MESGIKRMTSAWEILLLLGKNELLEEEVWILKKEEMGFALLT